MAMADSKEVGRRNPDAPICPICGHDHACRAFYTRAGKVRGYLCLRVHEETGIQGQDGEKYVFHKHSKDGGWTTYNVLSYENWLKKTYGTGASSGGAVTFTKPAATSPVKKELVSFEPKDNEILDRMNRFLLGCLTLSDQHRRYLKGQGWTDLLIMKHGVKSFPPSDRHVQRYGDKCHITRAALAEKMLSKFGEKSLQGYPGAMLDDSGRWTFTGPSGIVFPMYDINGMMHRLRVRMDFMDINYEISHQTDGSGVFFVDGTRYQVSMKGFKNLDTGKKVNGDVFNRKGKYRTLASNGYDHGTASQNEPSVYMNKTDNISMAFIVEGEPKSIFSNDLLKVPVLSVPGVNSFNTLFERGVIDGMREKGTSVFVVAYDADKNTNEMVLDFQDRLIAALREKGVAAAVADWDPSLGKGLDDLLAGGNRPTISMSV